MSDRISLQVDADKIYRSLAHSVPGAVREDVFRGMQRVVTFLKGRIIHNIRASFDQDHRATLPQQSPKLEDSVVTSVVEMGDLIVGEAGFDLGVTPHARILELGGVISPHLIRPRSALALRMPSASLRDRDQIADESLFAWDVWHPGARIAPYRFMESALDDTLAELGPTIESAVVNAIRRSIS